MSNQVAKRLAEKLIRIYTEHKLPHYAKINATFPEGFTKERIERDPENGLFQIIILAAYDRRPFTRWAGGFEPIWGLAISGESLPSILRTARLFEMGSVLKLTEAAIDHGLAGCSFYGHHLASYGETHYSKTFKEAAKSVSSLLSDITLARTADDVKVIHKKLDSIPGIGKTIASKLVMYTLRELPYFGSSIHPRELYPVVRPILGEHHNKKLFSELESCYGHDIVEKTLQELKEMGDPFAVDALFYVDRVAREEPELKRCLLELATDEAGVEEGEMDENNEIFPACRAIVEAKNYPTDGEKEPRREITITLGWTTCLMCKGGPLDLSTVKHNYRTSLSDRGEKQVLLIPIKLWIGSQEYSAKLHYHLVKRYSWIGSPLALNGRKTKLGEVLSAQGFTTNEILHLKFIGNEVWVIKLCPPTLTHN